MTSRLRCLCVAAVLACAVPAAASVHDIHLYTSSTPDCVSLDDLVATITATWSEPEDQALAFWRWMVHSHLQTSATFEDGAPIWDPIQFYGSYPNTFCGYMASYLTAFADRMGGDWRHRYVELADHTVAELSWDAGATWHMFDTSMVVYVRRHDGQIASCADIAASDACGLSAFWGAAGAEPGHLYLFHAADECMTNPPDPVHTELGYPSGYRKGTDNPVVFSRTLRNGADSYIAGFDVQTAFTHIRNGWRNRLHLHPGHTYTRSWTPLGAGAEYARLNSRGLDPNDSYYPANIRSNGLWEIAPGFGDVDPALGWFDLQGLVHRDQDGGQGPAFRPAAGQAAAIATVKVDAANVLTSARVWAAGTRGADDGLLLAFSRDAGCTWTTFAAPGAGAFAAWYDLGSAQVGGCSELLVRAVMTPGATRTDCGLDNLRIEAITQLNRMTLPALQRGANRVRFAAGVPRETLTLRPTLHQGAAYHWSTSAEAWGGLVSGTEVLGYSTAITYPAAAGVPGFVTWRIATPTPIVAVEYGGSFVTRFPGPADRVLLESSWDGASYATDAVFDATTAPTWDARMDASPAGIPVGAQEVRLRYEATSSVDASSQSTGLQDVLMMVQHAPWDPSFAPVAVTWCWTEHRTGGDVTRSHTRVVTGAQDTWTLDVGGYRDPTMQWVRVRLAEPGDLEGYDDGVDVGPGAGRDKVRIAARWLDDCAFGRPYTVSHPAAALNPDTGGRELTDGVVIPPTDYQTSTYVQGQAAYWDGDAPVTVTIDLGQERVVKAVRVTSHQPNAQFGHAGTVTVTGIAGDGSSAPLGVIQHDDIWSPPGDHVDWGYVRSEDFADLPAGGRLAYGYWLVPAAPVTAAEVTLDFVPLAGHGLGLSEIQVFTDVAVTDWPDHDVVIGSGAADVGDGEGASVPSLQAMTIYPNPANPGAWITYALPQAADAELAVYDVRGRLVRTLVDGWRPAGQHRAWWDGRDGQGRSVASGVYLAVGRWGGAQAVGRITLVR
ncbi:MAG TPA: FlgD immunoglobulin-like domain containing protein [Candidatus Krumholzibacteria bacterium]|nr:FlgD immunoglobulin-like domain containing protein [Candidatus Krumholzibacteria bacterium]